MTWEIGVGGALIFAWIGVLILVAVDLSATARRVGLALLVACFALAASGCGDMFAPYCDDIGIYPQTCKKHGTTWVCSEGGVVCNDGGYELHYDCKDLGGVFCKIR
jgi:hypothetical protein